MSFVKYLEEELQDFKYFYHGSPSGELVGSHYGIHLGSRQAAKEALESRIGIPAEGEWDGTRKYGETLIAGNKTLNKIDPKGYNKTGFNVNPPEEDYYPKDSKEVAKYSSGQLISFDCKPSIFKVKIIGEMSNSPHNPMSDIKANSIMKSQIKKGTARRGYYYINDGEDYGSISAVVPNKSFIEIIN